MAFIPPLSFHDVYGASGRPAQIICGGMSYAAHNEELASWFKTSEDIQGRPFYFVKSPRAVCFHGDKLLLPNIRNLTSQHLTTPYGQITGEVELAVILNSPTRCIRPEDVRAHTLGYTVFNDITQRDLEIAGYPVSLCKGFRTFGPLGPFIVSVDSIPDPQNLAFELRVNGHAYQTGRLSDMLFSIDTLVSVASHIFELDRGDIITTGSPPGMFDYSLQPGDIIEAEIERLGTLRNECVRG